MKSVSLIDGRGLKTPRVVEIIGPAGAGKTTLCQALNHYPKQIRLYDFPDVRKIVYAPFFVWYGVSLVPTLMRLYQRKSRQLTRREFAWLTILNGWPSVLLNEVKNCNQVIILDQGPIYLLAEMREFGPGYLKSQEAEKLWQNLYCRWANTLDLIIWLDTTDENLVDRIRGRAQDHVMKDEPPATVSEFLVCYRRMYDLVLSTLMANTFGLRVLRFDTGKQPTDEIVNHLLIEFGHDDKSHDWK
jgi:deoxyadenosine/deoxycytidine kinase